MAKQVCTGAKLQCTFGAAPSTLIATPDGPPVLATGPQAANIKDHEPLVNIPPFGLCAAPTNPAVMAATTAALGVFTPMPCVPVTPVPWQPGSPKVAINNSPALNDKCKCMCAWLGVISVIDPGLTPVEIP